MDSKQREADYSHNHSPVGTALLQHEIEGKLAGELDEPVVPRLRHDEDALDMGAYTGTTWMRCEHRREADATPQTRRDEY